MVACIDGHDLPQGVMWRRVAEYTGGKWVRRANGTFDQNVFSTIRPSVATTVRTPCA